MNTPRFRSCVAVVIFSLAGAAAYAAELTPEIIADLKVVEDVQISPDGKWVSYLVSDECSRDGAKAIELWLATAEGPLSQRRLLPENSRVSASRWSPDGKHLAVALMTEKPSRQRQLVLLNPHSGETKPLIESFRGSEFEWSPDGRGIGFLQSDPAAPAPKKSAGPSLLGVRAPGAAMRFHVLDIATGNHRAVTPADYTMSDYAWSPRSDAIVAAARPLGVPAATKPQVTIFAFKDGEAPRALMPIRDQTIGLAWSPDGQTIAWCGREHTLKSGQLEFIDVAGRKPPRAVQTDFPGSLHCIRFLRDGRLAFGALENLRVGIYSVAADGSDLRADHPAKSFAPGSLGVGSFTKFGISFSADGSRVAAMGSGPHEPATVLAGKFRGELTRRTALNPTVAALKLGSVEDISWRSFDGLQIHGFLVKPAGFDPKKKYPMVVEVHGGPRRSWWATSFLNSSHWAQWLAHNGYVVLMPNPRGSEGRGAEFVRGNYRDLGGGDWKDVVAGMNHVLGLGFVDKERLALAGWSYGGYLTAWGMTQPEGQVFKAAIVGAGITNIFARGVTSGWARDHWGDELALVNDPNEFFNRSPIAHAKNVRAAVLFLHGDSDSKVPHSQAVEMFNALQMRGATVEGRIYPGEGHGINDRAHRIDMLNSIARWLETHVRGGATTASTQ